ncbi:MAG: Ig-like domain-containing domain [Spirosomataceae bacterium]
MIKLIKLAGVYGLLLTALGLSMLRCSQPISPTGGKRDTISPKLVKSTPINKQVNYKGKTIDLEFDEYIVVENLQQKLLITPDAGEYDSKVRPEGLRITFRKSLDSSKTYSLSFGDAVKDFAEKNPAQNLRLVFSTGSYIDSASVKGEVKDLLTNKPMLDVLVGMYYDSDTLNIEKMKPNYFTRTDSSGQFSIENIQPNIYRLVAFDDKNRSLTYNPRSERIAYLQDSTVLSASTQISGVSLKLFLANNVPAKVRNTTPRAFYYSVNYDKGFVDYKVKFENPEDSIPHFQAGTNELRFFNTKNRKDTLTAKITITDSLGLWFEHTQKIKFREARSGSRNADSNRDPFEMKPNFQPNEEIEPRLFTLKLTFTKPVAEARLNQIQLFSDSTKAEKIQTQDFIWENNRTVLSLTGPIAAQRQLKIVLPKSTFFSVENDTIPERIYKLPIMEEENYGMLEGEIRGAKSNFIVQLLDDKFEVVKSVANKTSYQFSFLKPAVYSIRVIVDNNNNGHWDTGDFKTKLPAEPIIFHSDAIKVKKNFVMSGIDVDLSTK